jgi:hypothetical protein
MTIAIALKVGDGVVLGADSASTLAGPDGVINVYFNAEKLFNLVKGVPLGMAVYGLGGLDGRSVIALAKDLRDRLSNPVAPEYLDSTAYTVESVANTIKKFFYDDLYIKEFQNAPIKPAMGFLIAGFSANDTQAEIWIVEIDDSGICSGPVLACDRASSGLLWRGQPEALNRLINGWSFSTLERLVQAGMSQPDATALLNVQTPISSPAMPIQDAIDLTHFLVEVTVGYVRFTPGAPTVAPPIDIAAITRHEKFKWVKRKHFYGSELNPHQ